jgi:prephenate dehydrogenase
MENETSSIHTNPLNGFRKNPLVFVFGGARGMGLWIAKFLKRRGCGILLVDTYEKTNEIAQRLGMNGVVFSASDWSPLLAADGYLACDVAVVAVPIDITDNVIRQVGPKLRASSLLMDVTSLKTKPMQTMEEYVGRGVGVIGTHPMFSPRFESLIGQTCIVVPSKIRPPGVWLEWWQKALEEEEGISVISTPQEHDRMMMLVQVLVHYSLMVFGATVANSNIDVARSYIFKSPLYEVMMGLVARIYGGPNPDLYYSIQQHPDGADMRSTFKQYADLVSTIIAERSAADYRKFSVNVRESLGESNVIASSFLIENIFSSLAAEKRALLQMKGQLVCVRNEETKKIHYGILEEVSAEAVVLQKEKGRVMISLKKARLLGPKDASDWEVANLPRRKKVFSFIASQNLNPKFLERLVGGWQGVANVSVFGIYNGPNIPEGYKKASLYIEVPKSPVGDTSLKEVEHLLVGIGCVV